MGLKTQNGSLSLNGNTKRTSAQKEILIHLSFKCNNYKII
jgi:hypothetical protein